MCGLVGVAGNLDQKTRDIFTELLLVDVVRGHHSTGVAAVKRGTDNFKLVKAPIPSPMFIGQQAYQDMIKEFGTKVIIGHNRFATVGEKNEANAHPFAFDNIVGAHNGTLDKFSAKGLPDAEKFGTDSEGLYNYINLVGAKEAIKTVTGAWALTWFQKQDNTLNLLRNKDRPLHYAYSADRQTLFWASEATMLEWVLGRNKQPFLENAIFQCDPDKHYKWTIPDKVGDKFEKPLVAVCEGDKYYSSFTKAESTTKTTGSTSGTSTTDSATGTPTTTTTLMAIPTGATSARRDFANHKRHGSASLPAYHQKVNTAKFRPPYKNAYGGIVNKVNFEKMVAEGCVFCDDTGSKWGDFIKPLKDDLDGRKLFLCEECYNDDDIRLLVDHTL